MTRSGIPPAGMLRHRVTLQAPVETTDSFGQRLQSWRTLGTYWAFVRPLHGREGANAKQIKAEATDQVTMRWTGTGAGRAIDPTMRLLFNGRHLNVVSVLNRDERNRQLDLLCTEVVQPPGSQ